MVGGRISQSIDIGKDLEQEKPAEQPQEQKKEELPKESPAAEAPASPSAEEPRPELATPEPASSAETTQAPAESPAISFPEEPADEEEPAPEQSRPPDPLEEDVNEIITKDVPVLKPRTTFARQAARYRFLVILLLVFAAGSWFAFRATNVPELDSAPVESLGAQPAAAAVALQPMVQVLNETRVAEEQEPSKPGPAPAPAAQSSIDELGSMLAQRLKD